MKKAIAFIGLTLAVLLWAVSFISLDIILKKFTVAELNIIRFLVVNLILWLVQALRNKKMTFDQRDLPMVFVAGVFGTAGYYYFENMGLNYCSPGIVGIVTGAIPMTTLVIAMLFFGKKTRFKNIFLVGLSFTGVLILMAPNQEAVGANPVGVGVVMVANVFWALYTLFNEGFNKKYDKLQLLTVQYTSGMVALFAFYLYELSKNPEMQILTMDRILEDSLIFGHILFVSVFVSILAYFFYNYALSHIGVMITALFINIIPVLTIVISASIQYETLTFTKVLGSLLVVIAVFFIDDI